MNPSIRALRTGCFSLALLGTIGVAGGGAQSVTPGETVRSVQRTLERLPYYGVFDYIVFRVDGGTVYLAGYSFEGRLKEDAEMAAKRASGVVDNATDRQLAEVRAREVTGVFEVENSLIVAREAEKESH
jgi:hypothetical protein